MANVMLGNRVGDSWPVKRFKAAPVFLAIWMMVGSAHAGDDDRGFSLEFEGGPVWQARNDVRSPGDSGTLFSLTDVTGSGPFWSSRVYVNYALSPKHEFRLLYAPLSIEETGVLPETVSFAGTMFDPGQTTGSYRFDSYRLTYRYRFYNGPKWSWKIGFTGKIRDAGVKLVQGSKSAVDTNTGFVPLAHVSGARVLGNRWRLILDLDGLGAPQGRAIDFAAKLSYDISRNLSVSAGYRLLEGGADNKTVYTFAWLNYFVASVRLRL